MSDLNWTKRFAFYSASQLRLGNIIEAGFAAAVLFEKYIKDELKRHGLQKSMTGDFLYNAIQQLEEADPHVYNAELLNALRKIRNAAVIHCDDNFENYDNPPARLRIKGDILKLVNFVWERLDPDRFSRYRCIDAIPHIHADFAVLGVREYYQDNIHHIPPGEATIKPEDFNDLLHMRRHFLQLGEFFQRGILKKYRNLEVDLVSHVDTTSGYVWLAVNHTRPSPDHLRDRIRHSSVSIFATPLYLRLSIDFGGEDYLGREDYYRFLATEEARTFIQANPDLNFVDLEWYAFVTQASNAVSLVNNDILAQHIEQANSKLQNDKRNNKIITWERLLLGYIMPKGEIRYDDLVNLLKPLIELYYRLEKFRKDTLNRNNGLEWTPLWT